MDVTLLLHKPIAYGSDAANAAFYCLVVVHAIPAAIAPIAAIVALASTKGKKLHVRAGKTFLWTMGFIAATGIVIDSIRLGVAVDANHQKYADAGMPSSYPARFAFLYAGLCVLYLLYEGVGKRVFHRTPARTPRLYLLLPASLLALGVALTLLIALRYNPFTGALWMVASFIVLVALAMRARLRHEMGLGDGITQHRVTMSFLGAFSWWGALQGFGPAIAVWLKGVDPSVAPYTGNLPGGYTPVLWFFLIGYAPPFVIAALLIRRFSRSRGSSRAAPTP